MSAAQNPAAGGWTVIVPVKGTSRGKSRIAVDVLVRREIALALAADTVAAAADADQVDRVLVVAEEQADAAVLGAIVGVEVLLTPATTLNAAIDDGLGRADGLVAVLPADLPGITGAELDRALAAAVVLLSDAPMVLIPDRQGIGTTLLAAASPADLQARYGADSARRHRESGAVTLQVPPENPLRRDVDTLEDLAEVRAGRTADVVAAAGLFTIGEVR